MLTATDEQPSPPSPAGTVLIAVGGYVTVVLGFVDGREPALGPMNAPAVGTVVSADPTIVAASASISETTAPQVTLRLDGLNPGKAAVAYRNGEIALNFSVEVVRRVATSIVLLNDSLSRYPLP